MRYSTFLALMLWGCVSGVSGMAVASVEASAQAQPPSPRALFCTLPRPLLKTYLQLRYRQRLRDLSESYVETLGHLAAWRYVAADTEAQDLDLQRKLRQLKGKALEVAEKDREAVKEAQRAFDSLPDRASVDSLTIKVLDGLDWLQLLEAWSGDEGHPLVCADSEPELIAIARATGGTDPEREEIDALVAHIDELRSQRDYLQRRFSARDPVLWKLVNVEVNLYINARPLADARYRLLRAELERSRGAEPSAIVAAIPQAIGDAPADPPTQAATPSASPQVAEGGRPASPPAASEAAGDEPSTADQAPEVAHQAAPLASQAPPARDPVQSEVRKVVSVVYDWAGAWASRDVDRYLAFYSPDFRPSRGGGRSAWEKARRRIIGRARNIHIELENIDVEVEGNKAVASFIQHYRASNYRSTGRKVLHLQREGERWLIVSESNR